MKLGAQLYSLRNECDTPEKLYNCFKRVNEIGYEQVQASGICAIDGKRLRSYIDEFQLPVGCTHRPFTEITEQTEKCIEFHKEIGCNVIGLGMMPVEYQNDYEGIVSLCNILKEPIKKITDAGLRFAYHNHALEFKSYNGVQIIDYMIDALPDLDFIFDVYWSTYAGADTEKYIRLLSKEGRLNHIHFKDMKSAPQGPICACGDGIIDFRALTKLSLECGIENVYVEQDNAPSFDAFNEMTKSYNHLKNIFGSEN